MSKQSWTCIWYFDYGGASTPGLAAAVTNAGGLGGLGMWGRSADEAERRIAGFRQQSGGSLNVNYPIWSDPRCAPETSAAMRVSASLNPVRAGRVFT